MLFTPFRLASGLTVKNRLVVAPMTTSSSYPDGRVHPQELDFLRRRAEGGFGLVMTAACYVHPSGKAFDDQWACSSDEFIPSLRQMADSIHEGGAAAVLQIHHGGRMAPGRLCGGTPWSASAIPAERPGAETPHEMTEAEIEMIIDSFAQAARRGKEAGYDSVELHGANTYLIQQFVSPHSNRREDEWGQDRLKFPLAVVDAVRAAVGGNYSVGYRFSPEEAETPGIRMEHTEALIEALLTRPLDFLHVSLRDFRSSGLHATEGEPLLKRISSQVNGRMPLMGAGSIKTSEDAEECLNMGIDFAALARVAVSEPEFGRRALSGEPMRTLIPAQGAAQELTIPEPLAEKIYAVKGWFEVEPAT